MKSVFILALLFTSSVFGHGGINGPAPFTTACSATSDNASCGEGNAPCGPGDSVTNPTPTLTVNAGDNINVGFWQKIGHAPTTGSNTYQILFWENGATSGSSVLSQNQVDTSSNIQLNFTVTIPSTAANGNGKLQFIYDCSAAGAAIYYTCASIKIQGGTSGSSSSDAASVMGSLALTAAAAVIAY